MIEQPVLLEFNPTNIWDAKKLAIIKRLNEVFYMDTLDELEVYIIATLQSERLRMDAKLRQDSYSPDVSFH